MRNRIPGTCDICKRRYRHTEKDKEEQSVCVMLCFGGSLVDLNICPECREKKYEMVNEALKYATPTNRENGAS